MENLLCINYKLLFSSFTRLTALSLLCSHFSPMFIKLQKNLLIENTHNFTQRTDETETWAPHSHDEGHNACWWSLRKWKSFVWFIFLALGLGEGARARRRNLIDSLNVFDGIPDKKNSLCSFLWLWRLACLAGKSSAKLSGAHTRTPTAGRNCIHVIACESTVWDGWLAGHTQRVEIKVWGFLMNFHEGIFIDKFMLDGSVSSRKILGIDENQD